MVTATPILLQAMALVLVTVLVLDTVLDTVPAVLDTVLVDPVTVHNPVTTTAAGRQVVAVLTVIPTAILRLLLIRKTSPPRDLTQYR